MSGIKLRGRPPWKASTLLDFNRLLFAAALPTAHFSHFGQKFADFGSTPESPRPLFTTVHRRLPSSHNSTDAGYLHCKQQSESGTQKIAGGYCEASPAARFGHDFILEWAKTAEGSQWVRSFPVSGREVQFEEAPWPASAVGCSDPRSPFPAHQRQ